MRILKVGSGAGFEVGTEVDLLLLSAKHPRARRFAKQVSARLTVLDDILQCATRAGPAGRVTLEAAFELQRDLRPTASMIVGPGESVDITR